MSVQKLVVLGRGGGSVLKGRIKFRKKNGDLNFFFDFSKLCLLFKNLTW